MFQIIFNPTSAAELAKLPKEKQLLLMGRFDDVPKDLATDNTAKYGRFAREGRHLYRLREGDYRIYFERSAEGIIVHRILSKNTLKDFLFRSKLDAGEETELEQRLQTRQRTPGNVPLFGRQRPQCHIHEQMGFQCQRHRRRVPFHFL